MESSTLFALMHMPITYSALVVENTSRCNAKCGMCYQSAGPKGSDQLGDHAIDSALLMEVLTDAMHIPSLTKRFHLSGGETFLKLEDAILLFDHARKVGFEDITAVSNGYWARNFIKGIGTAERLRDAGLTSMEISWDYWHLEHIPPEAVNNCIEACHLAGIETNLRLLATKTHSHAEALAMLDKKSVAKVDRISCCPVFPTGRASITLPKEDIYKEDNVYGSCHTTLNLTINAKGKVFPCCAGMDQTDHVLFGDIAEQKISHIAEKMNASPMLRTLVFYGASAFIPILQEAGIQLNEKEHANVCTLCWHLFSNKTYSHIINDYFDHALERALDSLMEINS